MEMRIHLGYNQLAEIVSQLPPKDMKKLYNKLHTEITSLEKKPAKVKSKLQAILLQAPTWTEAEYTNYLEAVEHFNQLGK